MPNRKKYFVFIITYYFKVLQKFTLSDQAIRHNLKTNNRIRHYLPRVYNRHKHANSECSADTIALILKKGNNKRIMY